MYSDGIHQVVYTPPQYITSNNKSQTTNKLLTYDIIYSATFISGEITSLRSHNNQHHNKYSLCIQIIFMSTHYLKSHHYWAVNAWKAMNSFKSCTMYVPTNQQVSVTTDINMFTRDVHNRPVCWLHLVANNPACTAPVAALIPVEFPNPEREGEGGKEGRREG